MNKTYFDNLPEELLIEICMYIKSDPILYELSEHTKKAYLKYLNSVSKGYINNFSYDIEQLCGYLDTYKEKLTNKCDLPDVVLIDKMYYNDLRVYYSQHITEIVYQGTKGNYFYMFISTDHIDTWDNFITVKYKRDWTKFWNVLGKHMQNNILIKNGYYKYMQEGLL